MLYLKGFKPSKVTEVDSVTSNLRWIYDNSKVVIKTLEFMQLVERRFTPSELDTLTKAKQKAMDVYCAIDNISVKQNEKASSSRESL